MCGATGAQTQLQQAQTDFYNEATQQQSQVYGEDQAVLAKMQAVYDPIFAAGPDQKGFDTEESNNLNAQAVEGTAENYSQAAKAVGAAEDAEGGGNSFIPSGANAELKQEVATSAAGEESSQENQILQANYAQGNANWQTAAQGLGEVSAQLNPTGYSGAATGAGSAASTTANEIAEEDNSWINAAIGAAGTIGGDIGAAEIKH